MAKSLGDLSGEKACVDLYFAQADGAGRYVPIDLETHAVTLKIQRFNRPPLRGTFTVTYSGDTTADIDVNASLYDISCAINALDSVTAAGGVEVIPMGTTSGRVTQRSTEATYCRSVLTRPGGKVFIAWKTVGSKSAFTVSTDGVLPLVYPFNPVVVTGDAYTREVVALHMHEQRLAEIQAGSWTVFNETAISVRHVQTGDGIRHAIQRIKIDPEPAGGLFTVKIGGVDTCEMSVYVSALGMREALREAASSELIMVRKVSLFEWEIEWLEVGAKALLEISSSSLDSNRGVRGVIEWNIPLLHMLALTGDEGLDAHAELTVTELATSCEYTSKREPVKIYQALT